MRSDEIILTNGFKEYNLSEYDLIMGVDDTGKSCPYLVDDKDRYHSLNGCEWYFKGKKIKNSLQGPFTPEAVSEIISKLKKIDIKAAEIDRENLFYGLFDLGPHSIGIIPEITPGKDSRYS